MLQIQYLYRYVFNSPTNYTDPSGQNAVATPAPLVTSPPPPVTSPPPATSPLPVTSPPPPPPGGGFERFLPLLGIAGATLLFWLLLEEPVADATVNCSPADNSDEESWPIPWPKRDQWPKNCQLTDQFSLPGKDYDTCLYMCKSWGPQTPITTTIEKGGKCKKWHDWVPDPHPVCPDNPG